jgi:hypothetical protein
MLLLDELVGRGYFVDVMRKRWTNAAGRRLVVVVELTTRWEEVKTRFSLLLLIDMEEASL